MVFGKGRSVEKIPASSTASLKRGASDRDLSLLDRLIVTAHGRVALLIFLIAKTTPSVPRAPFWNQHNTCFEKYQNSMKPQLLRRGRRSTGDLQRVIEREDSCSADHAASLLGMTAGAAVRDRWLSPYWSLGRLGARSRAMFGHRQHQLGRIVHRFLIARLVVTCRKFLSMFHSAQRVSIVSTLSGHFVGVAFCQRISYFRRTFTAAFRNHRLRGWRLSHLLKNRAWQMARYGG